MTSCSPRSPPEGLALSFWKVALRPGKPLLSGRLGAMRVLGLPGNPVSAYVCAVLFLVPLIRRLLGRADTAVPMGSGVLGRDLPANDERADYLRATLSIGADGTARRDTVRRPGQLHAGAARGGRLPGGACPVCPRGTGRQRLRLR